MNIMNLNDFIKESIVQISNGIIGANEELEDTGAVVNPEHLKVYSENAKAFGRVEKQDDEIHPLVHLIEFDVAIEAGTGSSAGGGLNLSVASIGIGGKAEKTSNNNTVSRLQFKIPMVFPTKEIGRASCRERV